MLLQIFLIANFVLIGVLVTIAVQHAYAHFRPRVIEKPRQPQPQNGHLPAALRKQMIESARGNFELVIDKSADELEQDLTQTAVRMDQQLQKFGNDIVSGEMQRYHETLQLLRRQAEATMTGAETSINNHQIELMAEIDAHKQRIEADIQSQAEVRRTVLIEQIDSKLADAVLAFLTETLRHNVDLGAQLPYLLKMLDEHKTELTRGIRSDT